MKNYRLGYCALASMLLLASCQEDIKDDQPTINITSPAAGERVWLETNLKVDVADEQGVSKVMFYLDDELVGEDGEAPYELALDTKQYEDGDYTLRTVAYDGADNQTEALQEIEIFNKLLSVEVGEDYLDISEEEADHAERAWIIVSDAKGNVLQTEELQNGATFTFDRPEGFEEAVLSVTRVSVNKYSDDDQWFFATTYTDIAPDSWVIRGYTRDNEEPTIVGTATGSFVTPDYNFGDSSPNGYFYRRNSTNYGDSVQTDFSFDMYEDPAQLYIAALPYQQAPRYVSLEGIRPDDRYELTSDDMLPMKLHRTISMPLAEDASMSVNGHYEGNTGYHSASQARLAEDADALPVYLPEGVFDSFSYSLSVSFDDFAFFRSDKENMPDDYNFPTSVPAAIQNPQMNDFRATVDHQRDYSEAVWLDYDRERNFTFARWSVTSSSDQAVQWAVPALPTAIAEAYPSLVARTNDLPFERFMIVDRDDIDSYEAYAAKLYKQHNEGYKTYEEALVRLDKNESSRTNTVKLPAHVQRRVDQFERAHGLR